MDEDGFHSITWDDAPPRTGFADMSSVGMDDDDDDDDGFDKISPTSPPAHDAYAAASGSTATVRPHAGLEHEQIDPANYSWEGRWMAIDVKEPVKEHEGSKDMYVSYAVQTKVCPVQPMSRRDPERPVHSRAPSYGGCPQHVLFSHYQTNVPTFKDQSPIVRRRFQDFVFLHDQLQKSFPACVIPPIPDKHRLGEAADKATDGVQHCRGGGPSGLHSELWSISKDL